MMARKNVLIVIAALVAVFAERLLYPYLVIYSTIWTMGDCYFIVVCLSAMIAALYALTLWSRAKAYSLWRELIASVIVGAVLVGYYMRLAQISFEAGFSRLPAKMFLVGAATFGICVFVIAVIQFVISGGRNPSDHDGDIAQTFWADRRRS